MSTNIQNPGSGLSTFVVRAYFQTADDFLFRPYSGVGRFVPSMLNDMTIQAASVTAAADKVYALLNADERKNGRNERSLSVGDVLEVYEAPDGQDELTVLAVEPSGFKEIDLFTFIR